MIEPQVGPMFFHITWHDLFTAVEVYRSLHTLRLESLKLIFQPLHTFLVNKLLFRTSTLCMTQVFFQQLFTDRLFHFYNSLYHPVGQKFTYTKLAVPLNILENSRKWCHGFIRFW
jgi:hypothetical protein